MDIICKTNYEVNLLMGTSNYYEFSRCARNDAPSWCAVRELRVSTAAARAQGIIFATGAPLLCQVLESCMPFISACSGIHSHGWTPSVEW